MMPTSPPRGGRDPLAVILENILKLCRDDDMGISTTADFLAAACREQILAETDEMDRS